MVVHEWGTFTALQDDQGRTIGAINSDDEPVPKFVHRISGTAKGVPLSDLTPSFESKAIKPNHPDVTMRLETPGIYFYPPSGQKTPATVDVRVDFNGGWLSEFYPMAQAVAPDLPNPQVAYPSLGIGTHSSLEWKGLQVGVTGIPVETRDHVWITPREVKAALVKSPMENAKSYSRKVVNEPEKFLFYRGVGHLDSPLRVTRNEKSHTLQIFGHFDVGKIGGQLNPQDFQTADGWLVEIRRDGACAFRSIGSLDYLSQKNGAQPLREIPGIFEEKEFSKAWLAELQEVMRKALVKDGLFDDEAAAMLKTWELSYFKSPGLRLFYIVPHAWTDRVLTLTISGHPEIKRVMVGRIELITNEQRELLKRIAAGPCPDLVALRQKYQQMVREYPKVWDDLVCGKKSLADIGIKAPPLYQDYLNLGRFRNALLLDEQKERPAAPLEAFIKANHLRAR